MLDKANSHPWMAIANTVLHSARFRRSTYFSRKLIDGSREKRVLEKIPICYKEVISAWETI